MGKSYRSGNAHTQKWAKNRKNFKKNKGFKPKKRSKPILQDDDLKNFLIDS